jgi:hypothetical protein
MSVQDYPHITARVSVKGKPNVTIHIYVKYPAFVTVTAGPVGRGGGLDTLRTAVTAAYGHSMYTPGVESPNWWTADGWGRVLGVAGVVTGYYLPIFIIIMSPGYILLPDRPYL